MRKTLMAGAIVILAGVLALTVHVSGGRSGLKQALAKALIREERVPEAPGERHTRAEGRVIYVLAGATDSLRGRLARAADLYKQELAGKILIRRDDTLMAYSPATKGNPTHDEWARGVLAGFGVRQEDVESVVIESTLPGTYQEAKALSNVASRRGYRSLILVSSDYHTARVWYIFSKLMRRSNVSLYVYAVKEKHGGYMLLQEFMKYACYRVFL